MAKPATTESPEPAADDIERCARICEALCDGGEDDEKLITAAAAIRARGWDD